MKLSSLFVLASFGVASTFATTVAQVRADIATIEAQVTDLDNSITNFSGGFIQALAMNNDAVNLISTINKGTEDTKAVTPSPVSEVDGNNILSEFQAFEPTIEHALNNIVAKKPLFNGPLVLSVMKQDLANLGASTIGFASALKAAAPADLVPAATALEDKITTAFARAIAAYA